MAQRHPDRVHPFLDVAADAVAAEREYRAAERSLEDAQHQLLTELKRAKDQQLLTEGDVSVIETYISAGAFDRARQAYRERVAVGTDAP
jgi:hypothetical protein